MPPPMPVRDPSQRTAVLVMSAGGQTMLCPFFGKCDGLVVIDPRSGHREFHTSSERTPEAVCELILKTGVHRLILGFVGGPAAQKLQRAGIDIRLGTCTCAIEDLAVRFEKLPGL